MLPLLSPRLVTLLRFLSQLSKPVFHHHHLARLPSHLVTVVARDVMQLRRQSLGSWIDGRVVTQRWLRIDPVLFLTSLDLPQSLKTVDLGLVLHPLLPEIGGRGLLSGRRGDWLTNELPVELHALLMLRKQRQLLRLVVSQSSGRGRMNDKGTMSLSVSKISSGFTVGTDNRPQEGTGDHTIGSPHAVTQTLLHALPVAETELAAH